MNLHLRDKNPAVVAAWREVFGEAPSVTISEGDILELEGDAIVSPANSFGWMDGGIDLAYRERFGVELEQNLQQLIRDCYFGELPVGSACPLRTGDERIPMLIAAPTMRVPEPVRDTTNAYVAMRAALIVARFNHQHEPTLLCPGLCTWTGRMSPLRAAVQMHYAWRAIVVGDLPADCPRVLTMHADMLVPR